MKSQEWKAGLIAGIPIALGYLSVSFGIGILAVQSGLTVFEAVILSLSNLTSAGQVAGIGVIAAGGSLLEMIATQFVINLRYALMGLSLTQKTDDTYHTPQRLIVSFGITDEIYALGASRPKQITPQYMYGIILISAAGWTLGTLIGAVAGEALPAAITDALGIMLYGMFIAICIPAAKKDRRIICAMAIAVALSILFRYVLTFISSGFAIILCALVAAVVCALLFPVQDSETDGQ